MRGQIHAPEVGETRRCECTPTIVEYVSWPSIEAYHDLGWRRMREGPGCIVVNGLLISDPLCPACNARRRSQSAPGAV